MFASWILLKVTTVPKGKLFMMAPVVAQALSLPRPNSSGRLVIRITVYRSSALAAAARNSM
jgi:hypothetical protein